MYSIDHSSSPHLASSFPIVCPTKRCEYDYYDYGHEGHKIYIVRIPYNDPMYTHLDHDICPLHWCNNKEGEPNGFKCYACKLETFGTTYYFCNGCKVNYHKECVESPPEINVPAYHSKHRLQLSHYGYNFPRDSKMVCHCCGNIISHLFYYCRLCGFSMHPLCARRPALLSINHPKCHEHTLMYFHKKASLICNVCGSDEERYFIYICLQCDFTVHKMCIYLPRVIMVSRHNHRLSLTSSLPFGEWLCGVCHKKIDESYGEYLCVKGCEFAVHTKCATQKDVWDGRELEDEPEDEEENTMSFERLSDGTIRYFSHRHHPLRLYEKLTKVCEENTHCQACMLPLYDETIYKCEQCNFNLHQACADLPLWKRHILHIHPLILQTYCGISYECNACSRKFSGFVYVCSKDCDFRIDVKCGMVSEPFNYPCHPHPLFLKVVPWNPQVMMGSYRSCWACLYDGNLVSLECIVCDFSSCFHCATLPYKVKYKHDEHFLMLLSVENQKGEYWCEVCEKAIGHGYVFSVKGVYACNICSVTLHIDCATGLDLYQKPGLNSINHYSREMKVEVLANSNLTRPVCNSCKRHCQYKLLFKRVKPRGTVQIYCSTMCLF